MNGLSDIESSVASMAQVLTTMSAVVATMTVIIAIFRFIRGDVGSGAVTIFFAFFIYIAPNVIFTATDLGNTVGEKIVDNAVKSLETKPKPIVEKVIAQETSKKPKPVVESKPIDYKPFLYILGSIIGTILGIISLFFIISRLIKIYKFRKAYKFVTRIAGLPNDFMALSSEIDKIDLFIVKLNEMTKFYEGPKKQELMKLQVILEDKKYMFNGIINSIKAAQPELNSVYNPT